MPLTSLREIRILKLLDHPNVVPLTDMAYDGGEIVPRHIRDIRLEFRLQRQQRGNETKRNIYGFPLHGTRSSRIA